jgi:hypothetical protein
MTKLVCYKCGTDERLSIKSQRKETGYKLMICRACRNKVHEDYYMTNFIRQNISPPNEAEWKQKSDESIKGILNTEYKANVYGN